MEAHISGEKNFVKHQFWLFTLIADSVNNLL
ncbi:DUF5951 family protein [Pseudocitrobacter corydidari]